MPIRGRFETHIGHCAVSDKELLVDSRGIHRPLRVAAVVLAAAWTILLVMQSIAGDDLPWTRVVQGAIGIMLMWSLYHSTWPVRSIPLDDIDEIVPTWARSILTTPHFQVRFRLAGEPYMRRISLPLHRRKRTEELWDQAHAVLGLTGKLRKSPRKV